MFYIGSHVKYQNYRGLQMWGRVSAVYDGMCLVRAGFTPGSVALSENVAFERMSLDPDMSESNTEAAERGMK